MFSFFFLFLFLRQLNFLFLLVLSFVGGGRGCRVVREENELVNAFQTATSEAKASFGNGALLIEKLVEKPRHVEIQVFGDGFVKKSFLVLS